MNPTKKQQLFIITGASGVGKSTMCRILFQNESKYIVMESDILWNRIYDTPDDDYRAYRELWMKICKNISQIGMPVVLCGCAIPKQFELCDERKNFTDIHYLAVVCDDAVLERRMREGRGISDPNHLKSSLDFNSWLRNNANKTSPEIYLLDTSGQSPAQAAAMADRWIEDCMKATP